MAPVGTIEDGRELLQDRLAVFGKAMLLMFVAIASISTIIELVFLGAKNTASTTSLSDAVFFIWPAGLWFVMRRWYWSMRTLRGVDAALAISFGAASLNMVFVSAEAGGAVFTLVLSNGVVAIARAVVIPSGPWRTLVLALVQVGPAAGVAGWLTVHNPAIPALQRQAGYVEALCWLALTVAVATAASHITFGLRREVGRIKRLGQYQLGEKLGEGGMGVVYRASHAMLRRPTAIKLLRPDHISERSLARFEREVRMTARLTHPNTVRVYDYGRTPDGIFYYAMELLEGFDLEELVRLGGAIPVGRLVRILEQVCGALSEAHRAGLVHRDIKPSNVILCEQGEVPDVVKLVDFGLVKDLSKDGEHSAATSPDVITGTPLYMPPEAITSPGSQDARSDIYALGAVAYYLLTGSHVFAGTTMVEICAQHLHKQPQLPSERLGAPVPAALEQLILDCLSKSPSDRPQSAASFLQRLGQLPSCQPWTDAEARRWWSEHRSATRRDPPAPAGTDQTELQVDLSGRRTPGHPPG